MTQAELLVAWRRGDAQAGQALAKFHYEPVYRFFRKRIDEAAAADLTQSTFETLCTKRDEFRGEASMRTYILAIARFKLANYSRKLSNQADKHFLADEEMLIDEGRSLTSVLDSRNSQTLVIRAMDTLDLDDQILLELKVYEGLTTSALAKMFRTTTGTISGRVSRARARLREAILRLEKDTGLIDATTRSLAGRFEAIVETDTERNAD